MWCALLLAIACDPHHRFQYDYVDAQWRATCTAKVCAPPAELTGDGECRCPPPDFHAEPWDGVCIHKLSAGTACGDKNCEANVPFGKPAEENCATCPSDCSCDEDMTCNPSSLAAPKHGCVPTTGRILGWMKCLGVTVQRTGTATWKDATVAPDLALGDKVKLVRTACETDAYVDLKWGDIRGRTWVRDTVDEHTIMMTESPSRTLDPGGDVFFEPLDVSDPHLGAPWCPPAQVLAGTDCVDESDAMTRLVARARPHLGLILVGALVVIIGGLAMFTIRRRR